jgi:short-subunit dehydrogenase
MDMITGKLVVVTGCTGGIGLAVCEKLFNEGALVIGINKNKTKITTSVHQQFSIDFDSSSELNKTFEIINNRYGIPDYIIHCAGSLIPGLFKDLSHEEIISVIDSNLISLINVLRTILPLMEARGKGDIIVVGSLGGIVPMPYSAIYSSLKFAVRGFCLSLYEEMKQKGINISHIAPGPVETSMLNKESMYDNSAISFIQKPLKPEAVAAGVLFLMKKPKPEMILPEYGWMGASFFNLFPRLFLKSFRLLEKRGVRRMKLYREKHLIRI